MSAAYYLRKRGLPVTLVERESRLGGLIQTHEVAGCRIEGGPDSFLSSKPAALQLIRELGLESEVIDSNDHQRITYIFRDERLIPLPDGLVLMAPTKFGPLVSTRLLSWRAKAQAAREIFRRPHGPLPDRSIAEFVIDHYGQEVADYLAEPLLSGVFGGDIRELSALHVLPRLVDLEARYGSVTRGLWAERQQVKGSLFKSLQGGMGQLIGALDEKLADVPRIHGTVESVEPGWRVRIGGDWLEASAVVLAVRAWQVAPLVDGFDEKLADTLASIPYSSATTVGLVYRAEGFPHPLNGFGFLVPKRERRDVAACTWVDRKFKHRAKSGSVVLRAFLGGDAWCYHHDNKILMAAMADLNRVMNLQTKPVETSISRWPRSMPQYPVGHHRTVEAIRSRALANPGLFLIGNYFQGVGIPDCIAGANAAAGSISSINI